MPTYKDLYNQQPEPLTTPFENIALAFSGGGFRAASFSLGVLSYLNSVKITKKGGTGTEALLEKVTYISSASGGTITNASYALHLSKGKDFNTFYKALYEAMDGEMILTDALDRLNDKKPWKRRHKHRNIINSFALSYDSPLLFNGATLSDLTDPQFKSHLEEVCFNSTEFFTGLPFRQQVRMQARSVGQDEYYHYGNQNICIDGDIYKRLKIADVLAASSCFPGGYEPIIFPIDFCYDGLAPDELRANLHIQPQKNDKKEEAFINAKNLGLMDGGITDNHGLESLMEADERRRAGSDDNATNFRPFDLIVVNDVGNFYMSPYTMPKVRKTRINSMNVDTFIVALMLLTVVGVGIMFFAQDSLWLRIAGGTLAVIPALIFVPLLLASHRLTKPKHRHALNLEHTFSQVVTEKLVRFMRQTPIGLLKDFNKTRFNSLMILTNDVFMKRIRQILFESFYHNPIWANRRKASHIYDLSFSGYLQRQNSAGKAPAPGRAIQIVAETASMMGTTLWFDEHSRRVTRSMACIIACGQFTTCHNLMDYVSKLRQPEVWNSFDKAYQDRIDEIDQQLHTDWDHFQKDPFYLFNKMGTDIWGAGKFIPIDANTIPFPERTNYKQEEVDQL
jgi:predicted acylesterase/phospholipase RssA